MRKFLAAVLASLIAHSGLAVERSSVPELTLKGAYPVDGPAAAEPSGLTLYKDRLYCVSDNHQDTIFSVEVVGEAAVMKPFVTFTPPSVNSGLDLEGITCDAEGNFYLACERAFAVLRVTPDGAHVDWVTPNVRDAGTTAGLFKSRGAYIEGLALLGTDQFLLCAERQPRGFIFVQRGADAPQPTRLLVMDTPTVPIEGFRFPDFTDLFVFGDDVYVLERNAEIITRVTITDAEVSVAPWASFHKTVADPRYRYTNSLFGQAEGMARDKANVYLILDNNGDTREKNLQDKRPLFFVFEAPQAAATN